MFEIPKFSSSEEAAAFGKRIAHENDAAGVMEQLIVKSFEMREQSGMCRIHGNFQGMIEASTQAGLLREAFDTAKREALGER